MQEAIPLAFPKMWYIQVSFSMLSLTRTSSFFCPVLKVVENLGVSYLRGTDLYKTKLEAELRKLKFPYRVSKDQNMELSCTLFSLRHSRMMTKSRGHEMLFLKLQFGHFVKGVAFL